MPTHNVKGSSQGLFKQLKACFLSFRDVTVETSRSGTVAAKVDRFVFARASLGNRQVRLTVRAGLSRINDLRLHYGKGKEKGWASVYLSPVDRIGFETELLIDRAYNFTRWRYLRSWAPRAGKNPNVVPLAPRRIVSRLVFTHYRKPRRRG